MQIACHDLVKRYPLADREVEAYVAAALARLDPGAAILGEEGTVRAGEGDRWYVIDPIDGTSAFVAGLPTWCVSIGLVAGREMVRLARVLPVNIAMRVALMGKHERLSVSRAYELGLVSEVVPHVGLMDRAWEIAETVNRNAPLAIRGTRLAIRKGLSLPIYEAELLSEGYRLRVSQTGDAQEGPKAFLEKRDPVWRVR